MDLTKHKKWIKDYLKENYVITGTDTPNGAIGPRIDFCDDQIFIIENWDSRTNILSDQVPFMKKDRFCKFVKYDTDRDGSYYHYRFEFPFDYVDDQINQTESTGKFVGRKLYLKWGKHMYVAIEKIPVGDKKLLEMECAGNPNVMLCNVYEDEKSGKLSEEILGEPFNSGDGFEIGTYFTDENFWKTEGEYVSGI